MRLTRGGALVGDNCRDRTPQSVNILALHFKDLKTMSFESFGQLVSFKILGRMTSNSDVIIICKMLKNQ
jgi:hypothetical protein